MSKKRLNVDWNTPPELTDFIHDLAKFRNYLVHGGTRESTIESYIGCVARHLEFAKTNHPNEDDLSQFHQSLHNKGLARSTINNYSFAIKKYHEMLGEDIEYTFLKRNDEIPYYFDQDDILRIFSVVHNNQTSNHAANPVLWLSEGF